MYGFVLDAIKKGCFKDFNRKIWQGIILVSYCLQLSPGENQELLQLISLFQNTNAPADFDHNVDYDINIFYNLVAGAVEKLKYTCSAVMQLFGMWFIRFAYSEWKMEILGRRPVDFFESWNDFMEYKASEYQNFVYDIFKVTILVTFKILDTFYAPL